MIDHMTLRVRDFAKSKAFYVGALKPLGYELLMEFEGFAGLGVKGKPDFWIAAAEKRKQRARADARNVGHLYPEPDLRDKLQEDGLGNAEIDEIVGAVYGANGGGAA